MVKNYFSSFSYIPRRRDLWILMIMCCLSLTTTAQTPVQVAGTANVSSAKTGDWTDPTTWNPQGVPASNARVLINPNHTVTVNAVINTDYKSVRIANGGALIYATDRDTELRTEFLVGEKGSTFKIGETSNQVQADKTAKLTFAWLGGTTQVQDPSRFAPGAVLMGQVRMHGAPKTNWTTLAVKPSAGATQLILNTTPSGWRNNDDIVVAGTSSQSYYGDEIAKVSNVSGNTVTLTSALTKNHTPPSQIASLVDVHVSNNTRNVIISSANTSESALTGTNGYGKPRGHMMFMGTAIDVKLNNIETENTGRTEKRFLLDDWSVPADETLRLGPYPLGAGKNPRGRYSIHFHRSIQFTTTAPDYTATPPLAEVTGCVVNNDPGWGFVNHSSHVNFTQNVAYNVKGSAFCTEAGNELGSFRENIAIRTVNPDLPMDTGRPNGVTKAAGRTEALADAREQISDFAWHGDGFWLHNTAVNVENNVVSGASGHAYVYWPEGLDEPGKGKPNLRDHIDMFVPPSGATLTRNTELKTRRSSSTNWRYDVWYLLPGKFNNNVAYSMARGVHGYYIMTEFHENFNPSANNADYEGYNATPTSYRDAARLVIENTTLWSMKRVGIGFNHSTQVTLKNNKIYGYGTSTGNAPWNVTSGLPTWQQQILEVEPAVLGMDLDHYHNSKTWSIENNTIVGFDGQAQALTLPINANTTVNGGTFNNAGIDIKIREVNWMMAWQTKPDVILNTADATFNPRINPAGPWDTTPWRRIRIEGNIQFQNPNNNIVMDPQFHALNPAQDAFSIWHSDGVGTGIKQSVFFMLPDDITFNFGDFNNSKIYFNEQAADFIPVKEDRSRSPLNFGYEADDVLGPEKVGILAEFIGKTNQQIRDTYNMSFGGAILPTDGTVKNHPSLIGGQASNITANSTTPNPFVDLSSPTGNVYAVNTPLTVSASASAANGRNITQVEFFQGTQSLGIDTTAPYSATWNGSAQNGNYTLTAVATDNSSATTTSSPINVVVTNYPNVSITSPNNGTDFPADSNLTVNASASDPDAGDSISRVDFYVNGILRFTDFEAPYSFNFENLEIGNYALTAVARDNNFATTTSTVINITVGGGTTNQSPMVSITNPANNANYTAGSNIVIDPITTDLDGIVTQVEFLQGSTVIGTDTTSPFSFTWNNVAAGNYAITARATDNNAATTTSAAVNITVNSSGGGSGCSGLTYNDYLGIDHTIGISATSSPVDETATAIRTINGTGISGGSNGTHNTTWDAGWLTTATSGQWIQYDFGSAYPLGQMHVWNGNEDGATNRGLNNVTIKYSDTSSDPASMTTLGGTGTTYTWPVAPGTASYAGFAGPDFGGVSARYVRIEVNTIHGGDAVALAEVRFDLNCNASNQAPAVNITSPANNANFTAGDNITINANASDPDGTITQVQFFQGSTSLGTDTTAPYTVNWNSVAAGSYTITAVATDNNSATTTSTAINISVNQPPTASITSPANNTTFTAGDNITINANASDSDGTITQVQFFQGSTSLGTDTTAPYAVNWNGVTAGSYTLTAVATDNNSATTTSSAINITVNPPNQLPMVSITSPANNASFTAGDNITINANASDSDGTITQVQFFQGSASLGTDTTAPYTFNWNGVTAGSYSITAVATDNNSATTTSAAINITVNAGGGSCAGLPFTDYIGAGHSTGMSASASTEDDGVATALKTLNGSGLSTPGTGNHNVEWADSWTTTANSTSGQWIQYDFGAAYPLGQMRVWNGNEVPARGLNDVTIKYSATSSNPATMTTLGTYAWPQATGAANYAGFNGPNFNGVSARYVRIEVNSHHNDPEHVALSEVRFDLSCGSSTKPNRTKAEANQDIQDIQITLYPNPVKFNEATIRFNGIQDQVKLNVFDTAGRQLISKHVKVNGNMTHKVDLSNLQSGNYFMILEHSKGTRSFQLIKE
ncbi:Ig-like domain-containing protein [Seonamhaeicola sp.]|uniref:Ig-like domain-containing protein n=1 Tax=Seonamhaeicola sp. TaxID=1912245 RepID=UPI0026266971|nr:Ig-like domain-containing protein [Seonamhaeicola sp.]